LLIKDDNIFEYWGSYDPNEYSLSTPSGGYEAGTSSIYNDWHTGYYVLVMGGYEYEGDGVVFDEDGDGVTGDRHLLAGQSQFGWPGDIPPNDRVIGIGPFPEWDYDDVAWIALEPEFYEIGRWELWLDGSVGNPGYWLGKHS
jgi:hypothetical protein